jgi:nucleoid-associated protein YgaU
MSKEAFDRQNVSKATKTLKFIGNHTVQKGETLSAIANQYYKSTAKEKWMAIYSANKSDIGDNPAAIRVGQILRIPDLG